MLYTYFLLHFTVYLKAAVFFLQKCILIACIIMLMIFFLLHTVIANAIRCFALLICRQQSVKCFVSLFWLIWYVYQILVCVCVFVKGLGSGVTLVPQVVAMG